jgi:hypothetical protein
MDVDVFVACDQCGQRSFFWVLLQSGRELTFCGHHGREQRPALERQGAIVDDYTKYVGFS